jgi:hypothetical protein
MGRWSVVTGLIKTLDMEHEIATSLAIAMPPRKVCCWGNKYLVCDGDTHVAYVFVCGAERSCRIAPSTCGRSRRREATLMPTKRLLASCSQHMRGRRKLRGP